ncbi:L-asparaginase related protein [Thermoplasma acidophilum]|uniref:Glutamyl-tRNA(Gln) amidotransferase subunit D n=1 Tax=Thermoplasma acidophilum (strain ATCC 25905 / DSM 1728 / JCM 9062 / NBRC 15155 / AMRC-C165) TaxID=273075 RepID=GATD_THEAC|nr:Glu-tRNA(Gln) amidotransferase subunit GatD [Thermoplasma acidophilum]Q9HJJ5.1 RecName: Full=Glutamyl-tRNA(Gln) amidotransferase subunit D; Short=Glu-ADT subunit D [Thermoplasma acidophilum DSM 1728]CAC12101.1 L-asparaginase related protein [Thermoplasma acidophilum]
MERAVLRYKNSVISGLIINESNGLITLKASNGYNMTFDRSEVEFIERKKEESPERKSIEAVEKGQGDRKISVLATGGTIASRVDYETGAVSPVSDPELIFGGSDILTRFTVAVKPILNEFSENLKPADWIRIGQAVADESSEADGVVVAHGTDTMAYTSSALAFMFERMRVPVVFVGAQRSSDRPSSDSRENMQAAINFAGTDLGEVGISMHASTSDGHVSLLRSVRSRKMHTSRRDAFESIGIPPLAEYDGSVKFLIDYRRVSDTVEFRPDLDDRVSMIYFHPGLNAGDLENMIAEKHAVVILGTGLGHMAKDLIPVVKKYTADGNYAIMASQCIYGSTDLNVYSTGRELLAAGVIEAGNMVPEVAYVKAMYLLGQYPHDLFRDLFRKNMRGEIVERDLPVEIIKLGR